MAFALFLNLEANRLGVDRWAYCILQVVLVREVIQRKIFLKRGFILLTRSTYDNDLLGEAHERASGLDCAANFLK